MQTLRELDDYAAGFLVGWFKARGIVGTPSYEDYWRAARDLASCDRRTGVARVVQRERSKGDLALPSDPW